MKKSLIWAVSLFPFLQQLHLFYILLRRKFGFFSLSKVQTELFVQCMHFVQLLEKGAQFRTAGPRCLNVTAKINGKEFLFCLRRKGSDLKVFESVILEEEYKCAKEILLNIDHVETIVDAGANIGLTTVYFFAFFPSAKFILIEPDPQNFKQLARNLKSNKIDNVLLLNQALWVRNEPLFLNHSFRDGQEWSISVENRVGSGCVEHEFKVNGLTLEDVCDIAGSKMDLLKIDIEGAERFLFQDKVFMRALKLNVKNVAIEIHDEFDIRNIINEQMMAWNYSVEKHGDISLFEMKQQVIN